MSRPRYAVVGAGLAGTATAWQLARTGADVTLLEALDLGHDRGSSHGSARIIRRAYPDRFHAALTGEAWRDWAELEDETGVRVVTRTGAVDFGRHRDVTGIARTQEALGIPHTLLTAAAARERWPQLAFDTEVLHHPDAGVVDADLAVRTMAARAEELGAAVHTGWPVAAVEADPGGGYRLTSAAGQPPVRADVVVVAAGPWLPEIAPTLPLGGVRLPPLKVTQQQVFHFATRDAPAAPDPSTVQEPSAAPYPSAAQYTAPWPVFVHKDELSVYGLPGGRDVGPGMVKVAEHDRGTPASASGRDGVVDPASRDRIVAYVERYLPGLVPRPQHEASCLYTSTATEDFLLDRTQGVVVVSPCSGHGAKFAPTVGRLAAGLATGRLDRTPAPFSFAAHAGAGH